MRFIVAIAALVVVGMLAIWLFAHLLSLVGYLLVGALVVGGGYYVYSRVRRGLTSGRYRLPR